VKQHLLLISLLFTAGMSQAETVTLELLNGDSVTGTIVEELSNKLSAAFTPDIKPANNFKAKFKFYPSIYSGLFTLLQYNLIYQSMSTPEVSNSASLQLGADF
jgi:hypothetical protein